MNKVTLRDILAAESPNEDMEDFIQTMSIEASYSAMAKSDIAALLDGGEPSDKDGIDFICREFDGYLSPDSILNQDEAIMCAFLIACRINFIKSNYGSEPDLLRGILNAGIVMVDSGKMDLFRNVIKLWIL